MNKAVTVAATATILISDAENEYPNAQRGEVLVYNNGAGLIFLGDADVTAANGFPLPAGSTVGYVSSSSRLLYGITASGTQEARVAIL